MVTRQIGTGAQYATLTAALKEGINGDRFELLPGYRSRNEKPFIELHDIEIVGLGGRDNPAVFEQCVRPSVNRKERDAAALATGMPVAEVDAYIDAQLATIPAVCEPGATGPEFILMPDGINKVDVNWWSTVSKGIFTIKSGIRNLYLFGVEGFNAKTGSSYNASGARLQVGFGLYAEQCIFHDCQDGILTSAQWQSDPAGEWVSSTLTKRRLYAYVVTKDCVFMNCGWGDGKAHATYIGPCLFTVSFRDQKMNGNGGHHWKCHPAGGFNFVIEPLAMDDDGTDTFQAIDMQAGKHFIANGRLHTVAGSQGEEKQIFAWNSRDYSPEGNWLFIHGMDLSSTVTKSGANLIRVTDMSAYKDGFMPGVPDPWKGRISGNSLTHSLATPLKIDAPGVEVGDNTVLVPVDFGQALTFSRETWKADARRVVEVMGPVLLPTFDRWMAQMMPGDPLAPVPPGTTSPAEPQPQPEPTPVPEPTPEPTPAPTPEETITALQTEIVELEAQVSDLNEEREALQAQTAELTRELSELSAVVAQLQASLATKPPGKRK